MSDCDICNAETCKPDSDQEFTEEEAAEYLREIGEPVEYTTDKLENASDCSSEDSSEDSSGESSDNVRSVTRTESREEFNTGAVTIGNTLTLFGVAAVLAYVMMFYTDTFVYLPVTVLLFSVLSN